MRCIYFSGETCEAATRQRYFYKPNKEEKENFCESGRFRGCPRFMAYVAVLEATNS